MQPPYQGSSGLGADNVPGLPRLRNAIFKGAFPFAEIDFEDDKLPVQVSLEAFNPMVPLDVDGSGLPIAVLRYSVKNPASAPTKVGIALSIQNPVGKEGRQATFREEAEVSGLYMENPFLPAADPLKGSFVLATLGASRGTVSHLRGWKGARWWDGALTFWDDFTDDGALDSKGPALMPVGSLAITETIPAGEEIKFTFMIAWHFPNRTPERCGWKAVEGRAEEVVGNYYTHRFANAWEVPPATRRVLYPPWNPEAVALLTS